MDSTIFVQNVKFYCLRKGVKPTNACKDAGVGGSFLSDINRGQTPSVTKVQQLAAYLGVTTSQLLGEEAISAGGAELDREELELVAAYRSADDRAKEMVRLALTPWLSQGESKPKAM